MGAIRLILMLLLTACNGIVLTDTQVASVTGEAAITKAKTPPSSDSAGAGAGASAGSTSPSTFTTSTGGTVSITKQETVRISNQQVLKGLSSGSNELYLYLYESQPVGTLRFLRRQSGQSDFSQVCSVPDDGNFGNGFSSDSSSFWVRSGQHVNTVFRRFDITNCQELTATTLPRCNNNCGSEPALLAGNLFFQLNGALYKSNASTGTTVWTLPDQWLSDRRTNWDGSSNSDDNSIPVAAFGDTLWTRFDTGFHYLWKLNANTGAAIGWANFGNSDEVAWVTNSFVTTADGITLIFASPTPFSSPPTVTLMHLNVMGF